MLKGKTRTGFSFSVDNESMQDDWEYAELLGDLSEHPERQAKVIQMTIGTKQYAALKEHCRKDGKVSAKLMAAEIDDIFKTFGGEESGKN